MSIQGSRATALNAVALFHVKSTRAERCQPVSCQGNRAERCHPVSCQVPAPDAFTLFHVKVAALNAVTLLHVKLRNPLHSYHGRHPAVLFPDSVPVVPCYLYYTVVVLIVYTSYCCSHVQLGDYGTCLLSVIYAWYLVCEYAR